MGCAVIKSGNEHFVRKTLISETTLDRIAEILGIPKAERDRIISGAEAIHIYRGTWQGTQGGGDGPPPPPHRRVAPPSQTSRPRRQQK